MNGDETLDVLKQIRDEVRHSNVRLESLEGLVGNTNSRLDSLEGLVGNTNSRLDSLEELFGKSNVRLETLEELVGKSNGRLESLEGRFEFLERRVSKGFEQLSERIDRNGERMAESEAIIAAEIVELAEVNRQIRQLLVSKLEDHDMVLNHEARIRAIEVRVPNLASE